MKKWRVGDKVKFLNEKGGGTIIAIKDESTVIVQLPDGMEIPYPSNEIIPDNRSIIVNSHHQQLEDVSTTNKVIYLAIEANTHKVSTSTEFSVYLCNLSDYYFYYTYAVGKNENFQCLAHGKIQPFEKQKIKILSQLLLKDVEVHQIQMLFYQENLYISQNPIFETIKLNEKTFNPSLFIQHPEFEKPVYIVILKENFKSISSSISSKNSSHNIQNYLDEDILDKLNALKEKIYYTPKSNKQTKSKKKYQEHIELDLHIEELVENPGYLNPHQKLQIQLEFFQRELHNAIANNVKKITIIHGVGNGRLKHEVREYLKNVEEVKSIEDAPYKTHGFGATVVYIK